MSSHARFYPLLLSVLALSTACAGRAWQSPLERAHPLAGKLWSVEQQRFVPFATMGEAARRATFVLLGEKHDNADHHLFQAKVLRVLAAERPTAVVLEMLRPEQQDALERFLRAHPRDAAGLGTALDWANSGWPAWATYQPIAEAALNAGAPLRVGDAARTTLRAVGQKGWAALPPGEPARLGLDAELPEPARKELLRELGESHCGMMGPAAVQRMYGVERLRDASLADAMVQASRDRALVVLIAGNGHTRRDWAVPWYLARRAPERGVLSISPMEVRSGVTEPAAYLPRDAGARAYDYLWFTPRKDDADPCVGLREQMKRIKNRGIRNPPKPAIPATP